jgi:hypothetical protein
LLKKGAGWVFLILVQRRENSFQLIANTKRIQGPANERHAGAGSDRFTGERNMRFSLFENFTSASDPATLCSHPFDDLLFRRWSAFNMSGSL